MAAEIKELLEPFLEIMQNRASELRTNKSYTAGALVFFRSVQRNKRCALAYLLNRLRRIQQYRWEMGACAAAHLAENMSAPESHFLKEYNNLVGRYSQTLDLDLTADIQPPRDLFIEVRVRYDCGNVLTESGNVALKPGTAHFLKRSDVEHLVRQGRLEHIV